MFATESCCAESVRFSSWLVSLAVKTGVRTPDDSANELSSSGTDGEDDVASALGSSAHSWTLDLTCVARGSLSVGTDRIFPFTVFELVSLLVRGKLKYFAACFFGIRVPMLSI